MTSSVHQLPARVTGKAPPSTQTDLRSAAVMAPLGLPAGAHKACQLPLLMLLNLDLTRASHCRRFVSKVMSRSGIPTMYLPPRTTFREFFRSLKKGDPMHMKKFLLVALLVPAFSLALSAESDDGVVFSANLSTFNEVPPKANGARGTFRARLSEDGTTLNWTFTWSGLTGPPLFAVRTHPLWPERRQLSGNDVFLLRP